MTDLLTPDEVRDRLLQWEAGLDIEDTDRLCKDYLTLWDRNKELEALIPERLIERLKGGSK